MGKYLILDLATTPIDGASSYLEVPSAPAHYKDPVKIAEFVAEKQAEQAERCSLDPDLGRIAMIGMLHCNTGEAAVLACKTEDEERSALTVVASYLDMRTAKYCYLLGYNSLKFDWPFLQRRAQYLGVPLELVLDRYKTHHVDLTERMTHRGLLQMRSLQFYVRRLGWTDLVKPLTGAEEAKAPQEGRWDELRASVKHDITATYRLAQWLGIVEPVRQPELMEAAL